MADSIRKNRCIRFSDEEWNKIGELAEQAGKTSAAYVRAASLKPLRSPRVESAAADRLVREIRRIGINLNQLTRLAHTRKDVDRELRQTLEAINRTVESIL